MRLLHAFLLGATLVASGCQLFRSLTTGSQPAAPPRKLKFDAKAVRVEYPNGLELFIAPDAASELAQVDLRIDIGGRDDPPGKSGLAHLAEHLAFSLSGGGPPNSRRLASAALSFNAVTDPDVTHFSTTALPTAIEPVLAVYADLLRGHCSGVTDEVIARERLVVYNEMRLRTDLQQLDVYDLLLRAIYPADHPYTSGIGGTHDSLAAIGVQDVCAHFQSRFAPRRASVVITGKVDSAEVQQLAAKILRPLPSRVPAARANVLPWSGQRERRTVEVPAILPTLALVFPFPSRFSAEDIPAQFLKTYLDAAVIRLQSEEGIAEAAATVLGGREARTLVLAAAPERPRDLAFVEKKLRTIVAGARGLASEPVTRELMSQQLRKDLIRGLEPLASRTFNYSDYLRDPEYGYFGGDLARIVAADGGRIHAAATQIFADETALTLELIPRTQATVPTPLGEWLTPTTHPPEVSPSNLAELRAAVQKASADDSLEFHWLDNGLQVILVRGASMPVVELRLVVQAGDAHAPADMPSLARLSASLGSLEDAALFDLVNLVATGGWIDIEVSPTTTVFSTSGLNVHIDRHLQGLSTRVFKRSYSEDELSRLREALERQKKRAERPPPRALPADLDRLVRAILGGHTCNEVVTPSGEELARYDVGLLRDFKEQHVRPANAALIVAGAYDPASIMQQVQRSFGARNLGEGDRAWSRPAPPRSLVRGGPSRGPRVLHEEDPTRKQLHVVMGYALPPEVHASPVAQALLAAMVEEAAMRVRTRLGASYSFSASLLPICGVDILVLRGDVEAARATSALSLLRAELAALRDGRELGDRLVRARQRAVFEMLAPAGDSHKNAATIVDALQRGAMVRSLRMHASEALELDARAVQAALTATLAGENEAMLCVGAAPLVKDACGAPR